MAAKLRKGDKVVVLAGKDKGKEGVVASVDPKANKAVVDGVNIVIRHTKQTQASQGAVCPKPCRLICLTSPFWMQTEKQRGSDFGWKMARKYVLPKPQEM